MASFKRNRGAFADLKELEYVAALHQTCVPETRENGTIGSLDVQRLLSSRYGCFVDHRDAVHIVRRLCAGEPGFGRDELRRTAAIRRRSAGERRHPRP